MRKISLESFMDIKQIRELIDLMQEKDLLSLELSTKSDSISLTRNVQPITTTQISSSPAPVSISAPASCGKTENAPMVGVFYSAPSPNDPAFVKIGQKVKAGDQLGIIEAMKIMNPLEATQDGIIQEILVKNGDVVQFGQPIVRYKA